MAVPRPRVLHERKSGGAFLFGGLDRREYVQSGSPISMSGMSATKLPKYSTRLPRYAPYTLSSGNAVFIANNGVVCYVDGTNFYYNGISKGTVTIGQKNIIDAMGKILIFPDLKYYDYANNIFGNMNASYSSSLITFKNVSFPYTNSITFGTNTMTLSSGQWDASLVAGDTMQIDGCVTYPSNNKTATILSRTNTVLTFAAGTFTTGIEAGTVVISYSAITTTDSSADFTAAPNRFNVGDYIQVTGSALEYNNTYATVTGVTTKVLSFNASVFLPSVEAGTLTVKIPVPSIISAAVHNNRIWGIVDGDTVYCTKLGSYNNWMQNEGNEGVEKYAWNTQTGTPGNFVGIAVYQNHVYVFKKNLSIRFYGDSPRDFGGVTYSHKGIISQKSVKEVNELLFMCGSDNDIYYCGGGDWQSIGMPLNETFNDAVAGTDGRCYYVSLNTASGWKQYVLDTKIEGMPWVQYDTQQVKDYSNIGSTVYALFASDNKIYQYGTGSETVQSSIEFKINPVVEDRYKWYTCKITVKVNLYSGATVQVYDKYDNGTYEGRKSLTDTGYQSFTIVMKPIRAGFYWIKIVGSGQYDLLGFETELVRSSTK